MDSASAPFLRMLQPMLRRRSYGLCKLQCRRCCVAGYNTVAAAAASAAATTLLQHRRNAFAAARGCLAVTSKAGGKGGVLGGDRHCLRWASPYMEIALWPVK